MISTGHGPYTSISRLFTYRDIEILWLCTFCFTLKTTPFVKCSLCPVTLCTGTILRAIRSLVKKKCIQLPSLFKNLSLWKRSIISVKRSGRWQVGCGSYLLAGGVCENTHRLLYHATGFLWLPTAWPRWPFALPLNDFLKPQCGSKLTG